MYRCLETLLTSTQKGMDRMKKELVALSDCCGAEMTYSFELDGWTCNKCHHTCDAILKKEARP